MAERRMFAKTIIDSDAFLEMPATAQLLYFHLSMRADDDGFINNCKSIMRNTGSKEDDLKILLAKKFVIIFDSGIVVIKHWRIHNYIQNDRKHETKYKQELESLELDENKAYRMPKSQCIQVVSEMDTEVRLVQDSLGEVKEEPKPAPPNGGFIIKTFCDKLPGYRPTPKDSGKARDLSKTELPPDTTWDAIITAYLDKPPLWYDKNNGGKSVCGLYHHLGEIFKGLDKSQPRASPSGGYGNMFSTKAYYDEYEDMKRLYPENIDRMAKPTWKPGQ
jgi:hypothetical protein